MPKPIGLKYILKTLQKEGFVFVSQKGSHAKYRKIGNPIKTVIVKIGKKEVPYGTFKSILLQSGIGEDNFYKK